MSRKKYEEIFKDWLTDKEGVSKEEIELSEDFCTYLDSHFEVEPELVELSEDEDSKLHNMASCMLSILDSIKLHDKEHLDLSDETLSEVMFRKMKGYNIDLNKELGFTHLEPVKKEKNKSDLKSGKEKLILKVVNDGKNSLKKTQKSHEEMIEEYHNNGFGDMHPGNIEGYKTGLSYTLGYTFGHLELFKKINKLIKMTPKEIENLILENKRIEKENKKHMDDILKRIKNKNK